MTRRNVLFVSSNGTGMGHLMRLLAIARRLDHAYQPVFVCMSHVLPTLDSLGLPAENVMSRQYSSLGPEWDRYVAARLSLLLRALTPSVLVLDASAPYPGVLHALEDLEPPVPAVWSRRALWKQSPGAQRDLLASWRFGAVLEPGDIAAPLDHGPTVPLRPFVRLVDPITYLDPEELLPREEARRSLDVQEGRRAVLVTLGAGAINDVARLRSLVVDCLLERNDVEVFVTSPLVAHETVTSARERVRVLHKFPLGRYARGFDLAVAASGYNTAHEHVVGQLPTVYLANRNTWRDNQELRAQAAASLGCAVVVALDTVEAIRRACSVLDDSAVLERMRRACGAANSVNGASAAAQVIQDVADDLISSAGSRREVVHALGLSTTAQFGRERLASVRARITRNDHVRQMFRRPRRDAASLLTSGGLKRADGRVSGVDYLGSPQRTGPVEDELSALASHGEYASPTPLFLTDISDQRALTTGGYAVDHVMPASNWCRLSTTMSWTDYVAERKSLAEGLFGFGSGDWRVLGA